MRVGVLGGGQLGRMLALAGYPFGLRFRFLEPAPNPPVAELGPVTVAPYDDVEAALAFADGVDVITYEFENVPVATARALAERVPVYPPPEALEMAQDRWLEKERFRALGIPTARYAAVDGRVDLDTAVAELGLPAVLKTRRLGYDGKGQFVLRRPSDLDDAWEALGGRPLILEGWVAFQRELSILGVRDRMGAVRFYPLVETRHGDGILQLSLAPVADLDPVVQADAESYATSVMERLGYVGVLAMELFGTDTGLLANEMAPRVHNSGHWTQDGAECSQFENHVRAVCGLPLGSTALRGHSAMVNILGSAPPAERILAVPGAHLHLYAKAPRRARKLGHVNISGPDRETVLESVQRIEALLDNEQRPLKPVTTGPPDPATTRE